METRFSPVLEVPETCPLNSTSSGLSSVPSLRKVVFQVPLMVVGVKDAATSKILPLVSGSSGLTNRNLRMFEAILLPADSPADSS